MSELVQNGGNLTGLELLTQAEGNPTGNHVYVGKKLPNAHWCLNGWVVQQTCGVEERGGGGNPNPCMGSLQWCLQANQAGVLGVWGAWGGNKMEPGNRFRVQPGSQPCNVNRERAIRGVRLPASGKAWSGNGWNGGKTACGAVAGGMPGRVVAALAR